MRVGGEDEGLGDPRSRRLRVLATILIAILVSIAVAMAFAPAVASELKARGYANAFRDTLIQLSSIPASGEPRLAGPTSVAVDPDGRVYVADPVLRKVRVFDQQGRQLFEFGSLGGRGPKHLEAPVEVQLNGADEILVTDRKLAAMYSFSKDGVYRSKFVPPFRLWAPLGVTVAPDGVVYVTDVGDPARHGVRAFSQSGMLLDSFGVTAEVKADTDAPGSFYYPSRLLADADSLFVADSDNGRIQVFDRQGRFRYLIPTGGIPRGLAFDANGHLIVTDAVGSRVLVFKRNGEQVGEIGSEGDFHFPNDVAMDAEGRIYIADRGTARILVWGRPEQAGLGKPIPASIRWPWLLTALPALALLAVVWRRPLDEVPAAESEDIA